MNLDSTTVDLSEVAGFRGDTSKVAQRDSSTPLRFAQSDSEAVGAFGSTSAI
ncbi:hypothetical protein BH18VER1_BH18VER1_13490 [soil metagenome]